MEYLTLKDVAGKLGVTQRRARQLAVDEKRIPYVRRGNRLYVPKAAWEAYQRKQVREALANCGMEPQDAA